MICGSTEGHALILRCITPSERGRYRTTRQAVPCKTHLKLIRPLAMVMSDNSPCFSRCTTGVEDTSSTRMEHFELINIVYYEDLREILERLYAEFVEGATLSSPSAFVNSSGSLASSPLGGRPLPRSLPRTLARFVPTRLVLLMP